jgi:hypothetical protein
MRYTLDGTTRIGKPVRVFDGQGNELHGCTVVDTDTDEVQLHKVDDNGLFVVHPNGRRLVYETRIVPGVRVEL